MTATVPYMTGLMTVVENGFNVLGYLPQNRFNATTWRCRFGTLQMIMGVALYAISLCVEGINPTPQPHKYLTLTQQMASLGILLVNHGLFNSIRSYAEKHGTGILLLSYDFYGRKILPPLAPSFDLQGRVFETMRQQLDRIISIKLIPLEFSLRA